MKAWHLYKGLLDDGFFTPGYLSDDYPTASNLFLTGRAPMFSMRPWFLGNIESTAPDANIGVMAFPSVEGAPGLQTDLVTNGLVVTVTATSEHPDEAKIFLDYLMSEPVQKKWSGATLRLLPYTHDTSSWACSDRAKEVAAIMSGASNAVAFLDMIEDQGCVGPWINQASQGILSGDLTAADAAAGHDQGAKDMRADKGLQSATLNGGPCLAGGHSQVCRTGGRKPWDTASGNPALAAGSTGTPGFCSLPLPSASTPCSGSFRPSGRSSSALPAGTASALIASAGLACAILKNCSPIGSSGNRWRTT